MILSKLKKIVTKLGLDPDSHSSDPNYYIKQQKKALEAISPVGYCQVSNLGQLSTNELQSILASEAIQSIWDSLTDQISSLQLPEMTGGVNLGDQRAIFYLIYALKPKSVLEVGTHIGCSTVHIALALKELSLNHSDLKLTTVDIRDVNDPIKKPWKEFKSEFSPRQLIENIQAESLINFEVSPSLDFFQKTLQKFDLIFLDGLHDAYMVYQEIPVALERLNQGGFILLHDYFPNEQPLWEGVPPIVGPYLAVERLKREGANLKVIPLGNLPWPTKLETHTTSLALLIQN